ncbi:hypothetical protein DB346_08510 [Verrucomicrobia bacterium LW23]|nr:hypothetical protein DB346_08510 [Verrucomicrobia bacterium LW23]
MHPILISLLHALGVVLFATIVAMSVKAVTEGLWRWRHQRRHRPDIIANIGEGVHHGSVTRKTDAALASRYLLVKPGSDADHVAVTGVSDIPHGIAQDEATAAEEDVAVNLLGCAKSTQLGVASGTVTVGDLLVPAASGAVRTLPASAGTYYIIGRALATVATTELVEFDPYPPTQRVVE